MKASIIGTTGYGGVELLRILHSHPEFEIQSVHSSKSKEAIWNEYPHLFSIIDKKLKGIDYEEIALESDIVFLATPSGVSSKLVQEFSKTNLKIIDLSGDLRLKNAEDYRKWYKKEPAPASIVGPSVYGLSEWHRENIKKAEWIANPGCFATATLLGLAPVIKEDIVELNSIIVDAKSGISGAGRSPSRNSMYSENNENFKIYKVNQHQHTPEIEQQLHEWNPKTKPITFSTHLLPITRGIMSTIYVQLKGDWKTNNIIDLYRQSYEGSRFVRIRPEGAYPSVKEVNSSNYCDIGISVDERTGRLTIISVIDNLMKGAAGQAVQNANLMFGLDEMAGLDFMPIYP
ncbi:N-acetyl-gamma-glutamyl-phosphate reductase [Cytobacillus sp. Hz8]|uniref:N-acetyl-gamma-glutamyl-phosphate reductase n=1 Tax=Cytobacillus sp. Hz8 TaxID=3347168 RepID=UPI0035DA59AF